MAYCKYYLSFILSFSYMVANSQIRLNKLGLDKVRLGMNIREVVNAVPFGLFSEHVRFNVYPSDKNFHYLKEDKSIIGKHPDILYTFLCVEDTGTIIRLTMFIDDSNDETLKSLDSLFGKPDLQGDSSFPPGETNRKHIMWSTNANTTVYMIKNGAWDPYKRKYITVVHLYYPTSFENFSDYHIEYKFKE